MAKGFDCATPLTPQKAKQFRADVYEFVCRYLVPSGTKRLTSDEAAAISQALLHIVSVFETTADRALGGRTAGLADGATALKTAVQLGQPTGSAIYFAVDFNATPGQMPTVIEYIRAASEATPNYLTGVYGSYAVIEAVSAAGACSRFWQTYAWSGGRKSSAANLYQYKNNISVNGILIDLDESYGNEGWWSLSSGGGDDIMLDPGVAQTIINTWISPSWYKTEDQEQKDYLHWLANELRKASGLPLE
ncbi:DUF1906 domain-containing protein [Paenibacillus piri]|uniref:DUF1906 domain-containing protein n=1 Tax=Paenibacillus piri TaxID=2547395 RepID=A0A4R5KQR3_9BACL|nr:DUF1906 domain-containing protein [Paenibacillus piri]TDF97097.1 DUF1906 domain-containing protein [Paenibacillus piri]